MSLFFEERMIEQKENDPENDKITFTFPWILTTIPLQNEDNEVGENVHVLCSKFMVTSYNVTIVSWVLMLFTVGNQIGMIAVPSKHFLWNPICNISYSLFYDNDMRFELYSSPKISAIPIDATAFYTPDGFMTRFYNDFQNGTALKAVIFFEITLSEKIFSRPFEHPLHVLYQNFCAKYPEDMENDFTFEFMKDGDYTIKCPNDYAMLAVGMVLNFSSEFMRKHFKESKENEFLCEHKIDVIKPIIIYIHSLCFQMPKTYDIDFVDRLLKAVDFFVLENEFDIKESIHKSICQKLVEEPSNNFHSVLQFLSIAIKHDFISLCNMCSALISNKFYHKWEEAFPPNARNPNNLLFREIFGPEGHINLENRKSLTYITFNWIELAYVNSFFTNIILQ
uniref:BTB domain-containing protein n=1 Tax=Panagrolaimus davidi TaxID=227884 RepID=A0A914P4F1_9BILA